MTSSNGTKIRILIVVGICIGLFILWLQQPLTKADITNATGISTQNTKLIKAKAMIPSFFAKLAISEEQAHQIANTMTQPPGEIIYSQNPTWWPINTWPRGESPICTTTYHTNDYFVHLLILKSTTQFFLYINWGA